MHGPLNSLTLPRPLTRCGIFLLLYSLAASSTVYVFFSAPVIGAQKLLLNLTATLEASVSVPSYDARTGILSGVALSNLRIGNMV